MKCFYCEQEIDGREGSTYKHGKFYHNPCYVSRVHDLATTIKLKAGNIIEATQDVCASANSEARRIAEIAEMLQ